MIAPSHEEVNQATEVLVRWLVQTHEQHDIDTVIVKGNASTGEGEIQRAFFFITLDPCAAGELEKRLGEIAGAPVLRERFNRQGGRLPSPGGAS